MYKLLLFITYISHPCKNTRYLCVVYAFLSYLLSLGMDYVPLLKDGGNFFITVMLFEATVLFFVCKALRATRRLLVLMLIQLTALLYNYYELTNYGLSPTVTYKHYTTINIVLLELTMLTIWWGVSFTSVIQRLKEIPKVGLIIAGVTFGWLLYMNSLFI